MSNEKRAPIERTLAELPSGDRPAIRTDKFDPSYDYPFEGSAGSEVKAWKARALTAEARILELEAALALLKPTEA